LSRGEPWCGCNDPARPLGLGKASCFLVTGASVCCSVVDGDVFGAGPRGDVRLCCSGCATLVLSCPLPPPPCSPSTFPGAMNTATPHLPPDMFYAGMAPSLSRSTSTPLSLVRSCVWESTGWTCSGRAASWAPTRTLRGRRCATGSTAMGRGAERTRTAGVPLACVPPAAAGLPCCVVEMLPLCAGLGLVVPLLLVAFQYHYCQLWLTCICACAFCAAALPLTSPPRCAAGQCSLLRQSHMMHTSGLALLYSAELAYTWRVCMACRTWPA
jgi:hypothetical protein